MLLVNNALASMPHDITCDEFCHEVTRRISKVYADTDTDIDTLRQNPVCRMAASSVVYSIYRKEIWMIGDCHCMVGDTYHDNPKPMENYVAGLRSAFIMQMLNDKTTTVKDLQANDLGRKYILPMLIEGCKQQNVEYAVMDGFPIPMNKVTVINVDGFHGDIVLASDGYPVLKPTLADSEAALANILANDPLCISINKATKGLMLGNNSFDDRSYIRFTD